MSQGLPSYVVCRWRAADLYLTSVEHYDDEYRTRRDGEIDAWKMTPNEKRRYTADAEVKHIVVAFRDENWWRVNREIL